MVDSHLAGPRPYNVQLITRKDILADGPIEERTMTPESRAAMIASSGIYKPESGLYQRRSASDESRLLSTTGTSRVGPASSDFGSNLSEPKKLQMAQRDKHAHRNPAYESESGGGGTTCSSASSTENSPETPNRARNAPHKAPPLPPSIATRTTHITSLKKAKEAVTNESTGM